MTTKELWQNRIKAMCTYPIKHTNDEMSPELVAFARRVGDKLSKMNGGVVADPNDPNNRSINSNGTTGGTVYWNGAPSTSQNSNASGGQTYATGSVGQSVQSGSIWNATISSPGNNKISIQHNAASSATPGIKNQTKMRHIIVKIDGSTLELKEQPKITPREMLGLTKLISVIPVYVGAVKGNVDAAYNINIHWTELIADLEIENHFVPGRSMYEYESDTDVLNVFLFDPPQ